MLVAVLAAAAACVVRVGGGGPDGSDPYRGRLGHGGATPSAEQVDKTVRDAIKDIERYWSANFPELAGGKQVAKRVSSNEAMQNLQVMEQLQRLLATNVQEALALEVGLLKLHL